MSKRRGQKSKKFCFYSYQPDSIGKTQSEHLEEHKEDAKLYPRGRRFKLNSVSRATVSPQQSLPGNTYPLNLEAAKTASVPNVTVSNFDRHQSVPASGVYFDEGSNTNNNNETNMDLNSFTSIPTTRRTFSGPINDFDRNNDGLNFTNLNNQFDSGNVNKRNTTTNNNNDNDSKGHLTRSASLSVGAFETGAYSSMRSNIAAASPLHSPMQTPHHSPPESPTNTSPQNNVTFDFPDQHRDMEGLSLTNQ
eukprot:Awhi_evm1s11603